MSLSIEQLESMLEAALAGGPAAALAGASAPERRPQLFAEVLCLAITGAQCRKTAAHSPRAWLTTALRLADLRLRRFA